MKRAVVVRLAVCALALAIFGWLYFQTKPKPITMTNPPVVVVPPQPPSKPAEEMFTPKEKEFFEKLRKDIEAAEEKRRREGRPVDLTPSKGDELPLQPSQ